MDDWGRESCRAWLAPQDTWDGKKVTGLKLQRLRNFRGKHVRYIVSHWQRRRLPPSTLSTYVSHLRTICDWLGKAQLISLINSLVPWQAQPSRSGTSAETDRSTRSGGWNIGDVLSRAIKLDPRFAACLALMVAFRLSPQEAWMFCPRLALRDDGRLQVAWGTRPRVLSLELSEVHLVVLAWARSFVHAPSESMIPPGWTVSQCRNRHYYRCKQVGLTRRKLGVTSSLLRQSTLDDLHRWLQAHPEVAGGGSPERADPLERSEDRATVSVMADHAEVYVALREAQRVR